MPFPRFRLCLQLIKSYQGIGVITGEDENVDGRGVVGHTDALMKQLKINYFEEGKCFWEQGCVENICVSLNDSKGQVSVKWCVSKIRIITTIIFDMVGLVSGEKGVSNHKNRIRRIWFPGKRMCHLLRFVLGIVVGNDG
jgi:hypothetical protein